MPIFTREHIIPDGHNISLPYTSNQSGEPQILTRDINHMGHGNLLRQQFNTSVQNFQQSPDDEYVYKC